jgi:hypothetical protein
MATLIIDLPDEQFQSLQQQAKQNKRTVEEEVTQLINTAMPQEIELEKTLAGLALLDDKLLWRAAGSHLSNRLIRKIEGLHFKREGDGLTTNEQAELAALVKRYDDIILIRAEATKILIERGHNVDKLLKKK